MDNYFWGKVIIAVAAVMFLIVMVIKHNRDIKSEDERRRRLEEEEEDRLFRAARKRKEALELEEASRQQPMGMRVANNRNQAEGKHRSPPPPLRNPSRPSAGDNRRLEEIHRQQRSGNLPSSSGMRDAHRDTHRDDDSSSLALLVTAAVVLSDNNDYCPPPQQSNDYNCPAPTDYGSDTTSGSYD